MRWLLIFVLILVACPRKEVKPTYKSLYLAYLGDLSSPENLNYLSNAKGLKIAFLPQGSVRIMQEENIDLANIDLIVSQEPFNGIRTISPHGGYLIKKVGKVRMCIWAVFEPIVAKDSIKFLYLKQKPMLKMRSDFIITIGGPNETIEWNSQPMSYRFDFSGRGVINRTETNLAVPTETVPGFSQYDSTLAITITTIDNTEEFIDTLAAIIGVDAIDLPKDLKLPNYTGEVKIKDLGPLLDLSVIIDSVDRRAYLGLEGVSLIDFLLK